MYDFFVSAMRVGILLVFSIFCLMKYALTLREEHQSNKNKTIRLAQYARSQIIEYIKLNVIDEQYLLVL